MDEQNNKMVKKSFKDRDYGPLKNKLCAIALFVLGAVSMKVSLATVILMCVALFIVPLLTKKS